MMFLNYRVVFLNYRVVFLYNDISMMFFDYSMVFHHNMMLDISFRFLLVILTGFATATNANAYANTTTQ